MNDSSPDAPWPVSRVSELVRGYVAKLGAVWLEGQVVQFNRRASMAFGVLRDVDQNVSIDISIPASALIGLDLREGSRAVVNGKFEFWTKQGRLSFKVREVRLAGEGQLLAQLEQLKRKLAAEGLFASARKRPLPFAPGLIGLICGRDSKAEHDVVEVAGRRWPAVRFAVRNTAVQGPTAAAQVMAALSELDADPAVEVIVIARGGGSLEDLLPFSDESLVRAVAAAATPVVSAIGHEPDSPILDLVADFRAATPTDAGKRIVPDLADESALMDDAAARLRRTIAARVDHEREALAVFRSRPALKDPTWMIANRAAEVMSLVADSRRGIGQRLSLSEASLQTLNGRLVALSPQATLERGYAVVTKAGALVTEPGQVAAGDKLRVRVAGGAFGAEAAPL
ncbi:MAG: exodeoxyribonuclease VII large subunit [Bifidobacteriaceae bacterium]|jgi:exodeoxyribonuclease VII large subunit|nr:exodeoxyribonuclease VII large subunit [Bifidobacteriaceae bacterium]